ncbi:hypothetical protein C8F04DRAFT_1258922 [Mycena alexandri]|uniref:Uncharacterized protein n=1 Tax=Mycena alexandri TaxID=1745969 RepID=A0AAD6X7W3_9AGAR|nr:hypothetical protein C8F04DRAFT_1258922 [Mycena alexandri]
MLMLILTHRKTRSRPDPPTPAPALLGPLRPVRVSSPQAALLHVAWVASFLSSFFLLPRARFCGRGSADAHRASPPPSPSASAVCDAFGGGRGARRGSPPSERRLGFCLVCALARARACAGNAMMRPRRDGRASQERLGGCRHGGLVFFPWSAPAGCNAARLFGAAYTDAASTTTTASACHHPRPRHRQEAEGEASAAVCRRCLRLRIARRGRPTDEEGARRAGKAKARKAKAGCAPCL